MKTNAVRILEKYGITYDLRTYEVDESDLSGLHVAEAIGLPPAQVFKTLVVKGDKTGIFMCCIPTDSELDLKECAKISGNKKIDLVPVREIQSLTGYIRGGVSPVGTKKSYMVYVDSSAYKWPVISLSAGVRGCQMLVDPVKLALVIDVKSYEIKR
ncbi:MAG: Cys-tRNA(Pro) deacylase [Candidatus Latescibacteria bacterium]|nr:Cys-tRNA(Pro) deacylase [Candidatus Latescibacterota bacterium]